MLTQETNPVSYASRVLSPVKLRYFQTEQVALSILWACQKFHTHVYGTEFKVITDHKPLVSIFGKPRSNPPIRIERCVMKLLPYMFEVEYQPGTHNPADYLSRHPLADTSGPTKMEDDFSADVAYIISNAIPKALTLSEVEKASHEDQTIQAILKAVQTNQWHMIPEVISRTELAKYENVKDQLTATDEILLKNCRIVLPNVYRVRQWILLTRVTRELRKPRACCARKYGSLIWINW